MTGARSESGATGSVLARKGFMQESSAFAKFAGKTTVAIQESLHTGQPVVIGAMKHCLSNKR